MNNAVTDAEELEECRDISDEVLFNYSFLFVALIILLFLLKQYSHNDVAPSLVLHSKATMTLHYTKLVPGAQV